MNDPTQIAAWKEKSLAGKPVELPSGNTALIRRPGLQVFVQKGLIPNSLMPFVQEALSTKSTKTPDLSSFGNDPQKIADLMDMMEQVTLYAMIQPQVHPVPELVEDRQDDLLYLDEIDFDDKIFIYQYAVGGATDLETFRAEQAKYVGTVRDEQNVVDKAE